MNFIVPRPRIRSRKTGLKRILNSRHLRGPGYVEGVWPPDYTSTTKQPKLVKGV